ADEGGRAFDVTRGPMIRALLVALGDGEHGLVVTMHHLVSDGWSVGVLVDELNVQYGALLRGEGDGLGALAVQYADYAAWQRRMLSAERVSQQLDYWKASLSGAPSHLELPTDRVRPQQQQYGGDSVGIHLETGLSEGVKELSRRQGVTGYIALLAPRSVVLGRLSGARQVVIGSPVAGRSRGELEPLVGCFVTTLALERNRSGEPTVSGLLQRTRARVL